MFVAWLSWDASGLSNPSRQWVVVGVVAISVAIAEVLPEIRATLPQPGLLTLLMLVPLAAIYGCVPETDQIPDVGMVIAAVAMIEIVTRRAMGVGWYSVACGLILWAGVFGATGYDRAFIGSFMAFWPVVLFGLVIRAFPRVRNSPVVVQLIFWVLGGAAALVVARTGALENGRRPAAVDSIRAVSVSAGASIVVAVIVTLAMRRRPSS